jgi:drug/metabolite transporter (DMT)-like permease
VRSGLALGLVGVLCFSVSLPATRVGVREFGVLFVSTGRAVLAAVLAAAALMMARAPRPSRADLPALVATSVGVTLGFPLLTGFALQHAPAGHGSVVIGLLPAVTAGLGVVRAGERPSRRYWGFAALGAAAILFMSIARGTKDIAVGDSLLVGAVVCAAVGYTEGALLSRRYGGWQTISWAVLVAVPVTIPLTIAGLGPVTGDEPWTAWASFVYLGAVSMFLGFFAWYAGLARGGIARVSQTQLLQPLFSLVWATIFLREHLDWLIVAVAVVVLVSVAGSRRSLVTVVQPTAKTS